MVRRGQAYKRKWVVRIDPIVCNYPADWQDLTIYPIYDVHVGASEFDERSFRAYIQRILDDPHGLVILGGDLVDNATKSSVGSVYTQAMSPMDQKKYIAKLLEPIRDRVICIIPGNHENRTMREVGQDITYDITYDIAAKLNIEDKFRENMAFIKIKFGTNQTSTNNGRPIVYTILATHGAGGGMYMGGTINKTENYLTAIDGVDIMITGHVHKMGVTRPGKIVFDANTGKVTVRETLNVVTGAWMLYGGYACRKLLKPGAMGAARVVLDGTRKRFEGIA